ncbi:hypothetical protein F442_10269 [Phytophthora nicotianae P10297]|uniref:Uncharacterized protein n=3 Tax=Phytophthora nicotianae TaxID=4792 RepID=W2Z9H4_PHYNI|nr:hypothetical protein L915_10127 [Phytophthora nicotianae]ETO73612.1 hypothetical protein F444_10459 [Phytophthora nicotianae P1976]ETP42859.1 hypothetical protein F442_10269 [Phytophthora nicotianae P10297]KUF99804.1 Dual specificity protein phosphatase 1 [Phytophthora nicotianae]
MAINRRILAFLGSVHVKKLTEFRYVDVLSISEGIPTVQTVGPEDYVPRETVDVPSNVIEFRTVSELVRRLWPGSYVAHPVAYIRTTGEGVDLGAYGIVSGYTSSDPTATLHIVRSNGPVQPPLTGPYSAIKVDPLNYALQAGGGVNATSDSPLELLHQQNETVAACNKKKSGIPAEILSSMALHSMGMLSYHW